MSMSSDEILDDDLDKSNKIPKRLDADAPMSLSKMYQTWFLDYASYVILERAVPHIEDGLKPVQDVYKRQAYRLYLHW